MLDLKDNFICATTEYNTAKKHIPAPLFRREFSADGNIKSARLEVSSLGYYELHINGKDITKGLMAPYRSNPQHYVYYDCYDVTAALKAGQNVIGIILGNGLQNSVVTTWDFDRLPWASAPAVSFMLYIEYADGKKDVIKSDEQTKIAASPITFNDFHSGEHYDARLELSGWDMPDFDSTGWKNALCRPAPEGDLRRSMAEPIVVTGELNPVCVTECDGGYIYDFGENNAGLYRLSIDAAVGQELDIVCFEVLKDGKPDTYNFNFDGVVNRDFQHNKYICREGRQTHIPRFTYFGYQYIFVKGITEGQATKGLFTFLVASSDIKSVGEFECSDDTVNKIQVATKRSDISNFYYFPTDCPHREKQGWTADASLSAEQMLLNFAPENSYREWLLNIHKAMKPDGQLPGIIPTGGWGYEWGNGPAWDNVIVYLPYYTYIYRGDTEILKDAAGPLEKYLKYLYSRTDERGLIAIGLGDWCQPGYKSGAKYDTPQAVTDTIVSVDIANKAAFIYDVLAMPEQKRLAEGLAEQLTSAFRQHLIKDGLVVGNTQTAQAMALYYGMVPENDTEAAFRYLLQFIDEKDGHLWTGVLGARVIFRLLTDNGYGDLALDMITRPDFPAFGNWIKRGTTTLWERFWDEDEKPDSMNHHFWGDVSAWFYTYLAGIKINPTGRDINNIDIKPSFIARLNFVKAKTKCAGGEIAVEWHRADGKCELKISAPESIYGSVILPDGKTLPLESRTYIIS